jgi:amidase
MAYQTTKQLIAALHAAQRSAVELLDCSIARIEAHDATLNAVVVRDFERARASATEADQALALGERRPLLGVPITVKEAMNVAGLPTTWGIAGTQLPLRMPSWSLGSRPQARSCWARQMCHCGWPIGRATTPFMASPTIRGISAERLAALREAVRRRLRPDVCHLNSPRISPVHWGCRPTIAASLRTSRRMAWCRYGALCGTPTLSVSVPVDLAVAGPMARTAEDLALALDVVAGPDDAEAVGYKLAMSPPRHVDLKNFWVFVLDHHPLLPTAAVVAQRSATLPTGLQNSEARSDAPAPFCLTSPRSAAPLRPC